MVGEYCNINKTYNINTNNFYYHGISFTKYNYYKNMLVSFWGVKNRNSFPVKMNIYILFYDKNKNKIGEYKIDNSLQSINYNENNDDVLYNPFYFDKKQITSPTLQLNSSILSGNHTFKDVKYFSLKNIS